MIRCTCGKPAIKFTPAGNLCAECDLVMERTKQESKDQTADLEEQRRSAEEAKLFAEIKAYEQNVSSVKIVAKELADQVLAANINGPAVYQRLTEKLNVETRTELDHMLALANTEREIKKLEEMHSEQNKLSQRMFNLRHELKVLTEMKERGIARIIEDDYRHPIPGVKSMLLQVLDTMMRATRLKDIASASKIERPAANPVSGAAMAAMSAEPPSIAWGEWGDHMRVLFKEQAHTVNLQRTVMKMPYLGEHVEPVAEAYPICTTCLQRHDSFVTCMSAAQMQVLKRVGP